MMIRTVVFWIAIIITVIKINAPALLSIQIFFFILTHSYFGTYCQNTKEQAILDVFSHFNIYPSSYGFLSLSFIQIPKKRESNLKIEFSNIHSNFQFSLALDASQPVNIPNLYFTVFQVSMQSSNQQFDIQATIEEMKLTCLEECNELIVGIFNTNPTMMEDLQVKLLLPRSDSNEDQKSFLIMTVVILVVLLGMFVMAIYFYQKHRHQTYIRQTSRKDKTRGFKIEFLKRFFPSFHFVGLTLRYPSLGQFTECIICLETMKPDQEQAKSLITFQLSNGQRSVSLLQNIQKKDELFLCTVTPCFHMFHTTCIYQWLQKKKECPLCRQEFNGKIIKRSNPWIIIDPLLESFRNKDSTQKSPIQKNLDQNSYLRRMKEDSKMSDLSQMNSSNTKFASKTICLFQEDEIAINRKDDKIEHREN